jgi:hypothetical protein
VKVEKSALSLSSEHQLTRTREKTQDLKMWDNRSSGRTVGDRVFLSIKGKGLSLSAAAETDEDTPPPIDRKYLLLAQLIANLTGHDIKVMTGCRKPGGDGAVSQAGNPSQGDGSQASSGTEGWGFRYTSVDTITEKEQTTFEAKGVVTANGKEYGFSASLVMERSYSVSESTDIRGGDALKDPLVVNLGQGPAGLSGEKMRFDINVDGNEEDVPVLRSESGFLVFDKNGNGVADNGSELFGPATGNGFQELGAYDENKDGWIDEGDSVYSRLAVWRKDGQAESLESLKTLDIGAIYTGGTATPFDLKNSRNDTEARILETGVYLKEDGSVGTTQRLDIAL